MRFEILEHTADIGFRAWGASWSELLASAAMALVSVYMDPSGVRPAREESVDVSAEDQETFLVNWLNEVLYLVDGTGFAINRVEVEAEPLRLRARVWGEARAENHDVRLIVKGVTYHLLRIWEEGGEWACEVYLDV